MVFAHILNMLYGVQFGNFSLLVLELVCEKQLGYGHILLSMSQNLKHKSLSPPLPAGYVKRNVLSRSLDAKLSVSQVPRLSYWHQLQLGRLRRANMGPFPASLLPHLLCPLGCQAPLSQCLLYLFCLHSSLLSLCLLCVMLSLFQLWRKAETWELSASFSHFSSKAA